MPINTPAIELGPKGHWSDLERTNAAVVTDFVNLVMNAHDYTSARNRFGASAYVQHSRGIPDGIEGLINYLEGLTKRFPGYSYDVKHVHADGDYVTFHSHATLKSSHRGNDRKGLNIIDTWRLSDGQIVEHWDAIQPLSASMRFLALVTGGRTKNTNSIF